VNSRGELPLARRIAEARQPGYAAEEPGVIALAITEAALAEFAAVTAAKQRPGFPIAADLKH
jgi:hypothetical protein